MCNLHARPYVYNPFTNQLITYTSPVYIHNDQSAVMRDIREDLLQRRLGIVSRYFEAMARFDEQLQKLHEGHRKLMADIKTEQGAIDAMLAIENNRPLTDMKSDSQAATALLRNISDMVQKYPWEKRPQTQEADLLQSSANV